MDWNFAWLLPGSLAFLLAVINLIRCFLSKVGGRTALLFCSLSLGALAVLSEFRTVAMWYAHGEAVFLATIPTLSKILTIALAVLILINLIPLLADRAKKP